jgi:2'-5' RNA ligase
MLACHPVTRGEHIRDRGASPGLVALAVVLLPPASVRESAERLNASLSASTSTALRLDADHLPHLTLIQQFIRNTDVDEAMRRIDTAVAGTAPLALRVSGSARPGRSVWMVVDRTPELLALHGQLMAALAGLERDGGDAAAFHDRDARVSDIRWVAGYRRAAAFDAYAPHITLGHASEPPPIAPFAFEASEVAACHLGRFCTCRRVLRAWRL